MNCPFCKPKKMIPMACSTASSPEFENGFNRTCKTCGFSISGMSGDRVDAAISTLQKHLWTDWVAEQKPRADNANLVKWGVHTLGMDDWAAHVDYESAFKSALEINDFMQGIDVRDEILCFAYAAPWPDTEADHAIWLAKAAEEQPKAPAIAVDNAAGE